MIKQSLVNELDQTHQLNMKFILFINVKPTIVGKLNVYKQDKYNLHLQCMGVLSRKKCHF